MGREHRIIRRSFDSLLEMSSSSASPESWISSFCSLLGHEYFAEVSEDFIEDDFNLTGLQGQVPMYKEALEVCIMTFLGPVVELRVSMLTPPR